MLAIYDGKTQFYQWDSNQKLIVENTLVKEVHFTNAVLAEALVCKVYVDKGLTLVDVPNVLLQHAFDIKAFGFSGECVTDTATFTVIARAKPEDYTYTETEVYNFERLEERVTESLLEFEEDLDKAKQDIQNNNEKLAVYGSNIADLNELAAANILKGKAVGSSFTLYDVSAVKHAFNIKVYFKNMIKHPYAFVDGKAYSGVTVTDLGGGYVRIVGTATGGNAYIPLNNKVDFGTKDLQVLDANSKSNGEYKASKWVYYKAAGHWVNIFIPQGTYVDEVVKPEFRKDTNIADEFIYVSCLTNGTIYTLKTRPKADGTLLTASVVGTNGATSVYAENTNTTELELQYNRDINKAFQELTEAIISLGGNI